MWKLARGSAARPSSLPVVSFPMAQWLGARLTTRPHQVLRLKMSGAIPLVALCVFMGYSRDNFTFCFVHEMEVTFFYVEVEVIQETFQ